MVKKFSKTVIALVLIVCLVFSMTTAASAVGTVPNGTYTRTLSSGSDHSTIATLIVEGGYTRYSSAYSGTATHTYGTQTSYLCTQTQQRTQGTSGGSIAGSSYGSTFTSMANNVSLYDTAYCSMIVGKYYTIAASKASGTYGFRAAFPGAKIYENVDSYSSSGTTSLFYRSVTYVPSRSYYEVEAYKIN